MTGTQRGDSASLAAVTKGRWLGRLVLALALMMFAGAVPASAQTSTPMLVSSHPAMYYVALGDSFSSGNGLAPLIFGSGRCARSLAAYPEVVARNLRFQHLTFLACSGATITQVSAQASRVRSDLRRASLVTLSAGGNDLPFTGLSEACIGLVGSVTTTSIRYLPSVSGADKCDAAIAKAATLLGATFDPASNVIVPLAASVTLPLSQPSVLERRLVALDRSILGAMGAATGPVRNGPLVVVQYPTLLNNDAGGNCLLTPNPLTLPAQLAASPVYVGFTSSVASVLVQINQLLQRETALVVASLRSRHFSRITIVGAPTSFRPLDCSTGSSTDLNGIELGPSVQGVVSASLHPTAAGQSLLAMAVITRWRSLAHHAATTLLH